VLLSTINSDGILRYTETVSVQIYERARATQNIFCDDPHTSSSIKWILIFIRISRGFYVVKKRGEVISPLSNRILSFSLHFLDEATHE
jgi:hypothetical protein